MGMRYTLKVYPAGLGRDVYRVIEISGSDNLDRLCRTVLTAFDFIDEHLYEFNMDNKMYRSCCSYKSDPEGNQLSTKTKLEKLQLVKGQKFSLHYDYGDDWMFTINVQKITEELGHTTPRFMKEKGMVKQYPNMDDEDEWDEDDGEDE